MKLLRHIISGLRRMDLPFLELTVLLLTIGLIMLFSASYPSAYYETGDAAYYFKRQLCFAAAGAVLMLWADIASRVVIPPTVLPIGAITSFLGAPVFLYILFQGGRRP